MTQENYLADDNKRVVIEVFTDFKKELNQATENWKNNLFAVENLLCCKSILWSYRENYPFSFDEKCRSYYLINEILIDALEKIYDSPKLAVLSRKFEMFEKAKELFYLDVNTKIILEE